MGPAYIKLTRPETRLAEGSKLFQSAALTGCGTLLRHEYLECLTHSRTLHGPPNQLCSLTVALTRQKAWMRKNGH